MRPPCELVVTQVLPAFRSLVAKELIENHHFTQQNAAQKLGTTQAAISYYLNSKRGEKSIKQLEETPVVLSMASQIASGIVHDSSSFEAMLKFCELCMALRTQNIVCDLHRSFTTVPSDCDLCQSSS